MGTANVHGVDRSARPAQAARADLFGVLRGQILFSGDYDEADAEIIDLFEAHCGRP